MVSLVLIIGGILIIIYGVRGIFREQQYYDTILTRVTDTICKDLNQFELKLNKSLELFQELTRDFKGVINEVSWQNESFQQAVAKLEVQSGNEESFKEHLLNRMYTTTVVDIPDRYAEIVKLYHQGLNTEEIAQKLDLGIRETDLICKLYGRAEHVTS